MRKRITITLFATWAFLANLVVTRVVADVAALQPGDPVAGQWLVGLFVAFSYCWVAVMLWQPVALIREWRTSDSSQGE